MFHGVCQVAASVSTTALLFVISTPHVCSPVSDDSRYDIMTGHRHVQWGGAYTYVPILIHCRRYITLFFLLKLNFCLM